MRFALEHGQLDLERRVMTTAGGEQRLTTTEARLLAHLAARPDRAFERDELQVEVWGYRKGLPSRTVFTTVGRIRQKIEPDPSKPRYLVSSEGGYRFVAPPEARREPATLPEPQTPFIGREREIDELCRAVASGSRLVSLLGPGGIGKTRLALEVARRLANRFPDGVAFVSLESVETAPALARAVLSTLSTREVGPSEEVITALVERLRDREMLVVCDNTEQIADAREVLSRLVGGCPRLALLVTSRARLSLAAESPYFVAPMTEPARGAELDATDAGTLALACARRARPGWEPNAAERERLAQMCALVQGSPLGIELATSWLRLLDPVEVVRELERGPELLEASRGERPDRHASLRATLEATFRLLAPETTTSLCALAVLRAPFTREAAAAVGGAGLRELGQLLDASMIRRASGGRFAFHPAVRAEALARLEPSERAEREALHARYFLERLFTSYRSLDDGATRERAWLQELGADHEDIVAAFAYSANAGDLDALQRSLEPLYRYLDGHNRFTELAEAWQRARRAARAAAPSEERSKVLGLLWALEQGTGWSVRELCEGLAALEVASDELAAMGLIGASISAQMSGRVDEALEKGELAVGRARRSGRSWLVGFALSVSASSTARAGRLTDAAAMLEEAVACSAARGGRGASRPLVHLGEVRSFMGELERARATLMRGLAACQEADDRPFALLAQSRLGEVISRSGEDPTSIWTETLEEACAQHIPAFWWRGALVGLAALKLDRGDATLPATLALLCAKRASVVIGEEARPLEEALARARERLGEQTLAGLSQAAAELELETAALELIAS
jgi:predicted ATPase/DNA-binding winged helix-turn-helix (wHTH) protein